MLQPKHRSFRLTPEPYMYGKRVKPRLRVVGTVASFCAVGAGLLSGIGVILFLAAPLGAPLRKTLWGTLLFLGTVYAMGMLVYRALGLLYRQLGLMTPEEARDFPFRGRWPDSWLEPAEEENERKG